MASFDEILKKGKQKVKETKKVKSTKDVWLEHVGNVLNSMQFLNSFYAKDKAHHMSVDHVNCKGCKKATFILSIRDIDNTKRIMRFYNSNWKSIDKGKEYLCEECKRL